MKYIIPIIIASSILTGCCCGEKKKKVLPLSDRETSRLKLDSIHFDEHANKLIEQTRIYLDTLKKLSLAEKKALASLLIITSDLSALSPGDHGSGAYKKAVVLEINKYFNGIAVVNAVDYANACLNAEIAYATAFQKCKGAHKSEAQCAAAWGALVESMNCAEDRMEKKLASVVGVQNQIK